MEEYIKIINDDIKRFIENYLIGGLLDGVMGMSDLEEYIPSKYPHLSILYLLKQNCIDSYIPDFISAYELKIKEETDDLHKILGHFLCDIKDLEDINAQLSERTAEKENISIKVRELESDNESLSEELSKSKAEVQSLSRKIEVLMYDQEALTSQNKNLTFENLQLKKLVYDLKTQLARFTGHEADSPNSNQESPTTNVPRLRPSTQNEDDKHKTPSNLYNANQIDTVDMGTSVLWCTKNLGAKGLEDRGDYYSWGALETRTVFAINACGYNRVDNIDISKDSIYDAALSSLGEGYRIPTLEEWRDLLKVCGSKVRSVSIRGKKYIELISEITGNHMLLPIMGHMEKSMHNENVAEYWSSHAHSGQSACIFWARETKWGTSFDLKWHGLPIRPVYDDKLNDDIQLEDLSNDDIEFAKFITEIVTKAEQITEKAKESICCINNSAELTKTEKDDKTNQTEQNGIRQNSSILSARNLTVNNMYPRKDQINIDNVFPSIIKNCIPYGIYVFENDKIANSGLDLDKLNKILMTQYNVDPISESSYQRLTIGSLKQLIVLRLKK